MTPILKTNETRDWINAKSSQRCKVKPRLGTAIEHGLIITGIAAAELPPISAALAPNWFDRVGPVTASRIATNSCNLDGAAIVTDQKHGG